MLWATQKLLPLVRGGEFVRGLERGRSAALALHRKLKANEQFVTAFVPELDILVFAPRATSVSEMCARSRLTFAAAATHGLHLAVAELPVSFLEPELDASVGRDRETLTYLRSVLMKPEHLDWVDRISEILTSAVREACGKASLHAG
jgi:hypothetical protein